MNRVPSVLLVSVASCVFLFLLFLFSGCTFSQLKGGGGKEEAIAKFTVGNGRAGFGQNCEADQT